jgi:uridine kinase
MENVAQMVVKNKNIKAVFISGPSSSGKTTTSKKLAMYLRANGKDSLVLSTDDYFVNREDSPRKEDGSYEFEIVDAIDINLFSTQMRQSFQQKSLQLKMILLMLSIHQAVQVILRVLRLVISLQ